MEGRGALFKRFTNCLFHDIDCVTQGVFFLPRMLLAHIITYSHP